MNSDNHSNNSASSPDDEKIPEEAFLVFNGMIFPIENAVFTIGRNLENDLVLNDPSISRFHAEIRYMDSHFLLVDSKSSSGTFLNNTKITSGQLFAGDIIQISQIPIMFMFKGASIVNGSNKHTGKLNRFAEAKLNDDDNSHL